MQLSCGGCGRSIQLKAAPLALAQARCPYTDCRCLYIASTERGEAILERGRSFYRRRLEALRGQYLLETHEEQYFQKLLSFLIFLGLLLWGLGRFLGFPMGLLIALFAAPLLLVFTSDERGKGALLFWLGPTLLSLLLVASALTPSPRELFLRLSELRADTLYALLIGATSVSSGFFSYWILRWLSANQWAKQALLAERSQTPQLELLPLHQERAPYR